MNSYDRRPLPADQALAALRAGNHRFQRNTRSIEVLATQAHRAALAEGQSPNAIVLSCSDSRVPSEIVFDCGLGDLFVVRVAGNVCAPSLVGSVEFAAATFGTELVVVMGHTRCGAISATLRAVADETAHELSANIRDIVTRISPAVRPLLDHGLSAEELVRAATRANILHTADHLRHGSQLLEERIAGGQLVVVGAEYALETGEVDFFDVPETLLRTTDELPRAPVSRRAGRPSGTSSGDRHRSI
jgi:carbonic anhydrase